jgi:hypothetical protein
MTDFYLELKIMTLLLDNTNSLGNQPTKPAIYFNQKQLLERGWSRTLITKLLGEPDAKAVNPLYRTGPAIRRYLCSRVEAAEQSPIFLKHLSKHEVYLARAEQAVSTKTAKTRLMAEKIEIDLPRWDHDSLLKLAVENYNALKAERSRSGY